MEKTNKISAGYQAEEGFDFEEGTFNNTEINEIIHAETEQQDRPAGVPVTDSSHQDGIPRGTPESAYHARRTKAEIDSLPQEHRSKKSADDSESHEQDRLPQVRPAGDPVPIDDTGLSQASQKKRGRRPGRPKKVPSHSSRSPRVLQDGNAFQKKAFLSEDEINILKEKSEKKKKKQEEEWELEQLKIRQYETLHSVALPLLNCLNDWVSQSNPSFDIQSLGESSNKDIIGLFKKIFAEVQCPHLETAEMSQ